MPGGQAAAQRALTLLPAWGLAAASSGGSIPMILGPTTMRRMLASRPTPRPATAPVVLNRFQKIDISRQCHHGERRTRNRFRLHHRLFIGIFPRLDSPFDQHISGMQARTRNPVRATIQCRRLSQSPDAELGGRIGAAPFTRSLGTDRADIQNPSGSSWFHQTKRCTTA